MASPDFRELTRALYEVVSAPPQQRNWDAIRHYYHREARLVRTGLNPDGTPFVSVFTLDAYIENVRTMLDGVRFSEVEVSQESVVFGNVARLTSVYEYTRQSAKETVRGRGVNFFTLVHDAGQWRVISRNGNPDCRRRPSPEWPHCVLVRQQGPPFAAQHAGRRTSGGRTQRACAFDRRALAHHLRRATESTVNSRPAGRP